VDATVRTLWAGLGSSIVHLEKNMRIDNQLHLAVRAYASGYLSSRSMVALPLPLPCSPIVLTTELHVPAEHNAPSSAPMVVLKTCNALGAIALRSLSVSTLTWDPGASGSRPASRPAL
jgi:hypothetical protein